MPEYVAVPCAPDESGFLQEGFDSEEAAWEWIKNNHFCPSCLEALTQGGEWCFLVTNGKLDKSNKSWYAVEYPALTGCGAEWIVITQAEWETSGRDASRAWLNAFESSEE